MPAAKHKPAFGAKASAKKPSARPARDGGRGDAKAAPAARDQGIPARIAEQIRELIVRGSLSPGVHLGQMQLADQFEASRVPVREALKLLAAEGLLVHDPNRGFFVAALSSDEARQLYRMRHLMELELLSSVEWPDARKTAELEAMLGEIKALLRKGDRVRWSVRHREFHRAIFDLSPEKVLVREVLRLWTLTDRYRSLLPAPQMREDGDEDERDLVRALSDRDRKALLRVFESERTHVEQMLLSLLSARGL